MSDPIAWRRARAGLVEGIRAGKYPVGKILPTAPELQDAFNVSERPLRDAVADLRRAGVLRYIRGLGVIVDREPGDSDTASDTPPRDVQAIVADHDRRLTAAEQAISDLKRRLK